MKRFPLALVLLTAPVMAQETYQVAGNAGQVADLTAVVQASNERTCESWALAITCTQAEACNAASATGGVSCTPAQARNAKARLFPATQAGREEFVIWIWVAPQFQAAKADIAKRGQERQAKYWATASAAQKKMMCNSSGQSDDCLLY